MKEIIRNKPFDCLNYKIEDNKIVIDGCRGYDSVDLYLTFNEIKSIYETIMNHENIIK